MTAALIALSATVLALGVGLVLSLRYAIEANKRAESTHDLYRGQLNITHDLESERQDLTGKLAATDQQLKEATKRLALTEEQRNKALEEARAQVRREIRNAPDAIAALNRVLAAGTGLQRDGEAKTSPAEAKSDPGDRGTDPLLITSLP